MDFGRWEIFVFIYFFWGEHSRGRWTKSVHVKKIGKFSGTYFASNDLGLGLSEVLGLPRLFFPTFASTKLEGS